MEYKPNWNLKKTKTKKREKKTNGGEKNTVGNIQKVRLKTLQKKNKRKQNEKRYFPDHTMPTRYKSSTVLHRATRLLKNSTQ